MPTGRLRIMQIRNKNKKKAIQRPHLFYLHLKLVPLEQKTENTTRKTVSETFDLSLEKINE